MMLRVETKNRHIQNSVNSINDLMTQIVGFVRTNPNWSLQAVIYLLCIMYEAINTYQELIDKGASPEYAIARSCGAVVKLMMISILIPLSRVAYTKVQNSDAGHHLGLEHRILDHKLFASGIMMFSSLHAIAHYFYNRDNYLKQPGITGMVMLGTLVAPIGGVFLMRHFTKSNNKHSYEVSVLHPHQIGAAAFVGAYMVHTPDLRLLKYAAVTCLPMAIDRIVEFVCYRYPTTIKAARIVLNTDYMHLRLERPAKFDNFVPGQYVLLSIPAIDGFFRMPHPFTLVNDNGRELELLIKKTGPWTIKLYDWITQHPEHQSLRAVVIGPYGSPLVPAHAKHALTMIGTGIGMTPALAVLNGISNQIITDYKLDIHLSQRSLREFEPCVDALCQKDKRYSTTNMTVHFYLTGREPDRNAVIEDLRSLGNKKKITFFIPEGSQYISPAQAQYPGKQTRKKTALSQAGMFAVHIHLSRPNLKAIVSGSEAVSACGNPEVTKQVDALAKGCRIKCHLESF